MTRIITRETMETTPIGSHFGRGNHFTQWIAQSERYVQNRKMAGHREVKIARPVVLWFLGRQSVKCENLADNYLQPCVGQ